MSFLCGSWEYDPSSHICCDGNLSELKDKKQCCGGITYRVAERGKLCCNGTLHHNVPEGSRCAGKDFYNPNKETVCENIIHPKAHGYCCGRHLLDPSTELCCNGYRYTRSPGKVCCGAEAYNSSDPMQKCCSGHLHKLSSVAGAAECCGTQAITDTSKQQCCISSQWELVYSSRPEFSCCGHQYYNTSEFFCCAGILHTGTGQNLKSCPLQAAHIKECSHLNLTYLCLQPQNATVKLGTLEATWQEDSCRHIVLTNVFTIYLREGRAELKASPLSFAMDHCSCPELDAGRQYLWIDRSGDAGGDKVLIYPTQEHHTSLLPVVLSACKKS
ncbi:galaxin-like [Scleropages formosus]|uniref:galaxin-like n=1 Tax=Scleropages formosus TaxID=113540 RepID=UPI0010FACB32|nr:galaxin-like [Scleropages formosus]